MSPASAARSEPRIGAFFDMDKTLIAENSGSLYMRYRRQRGEVGSTELLRGLGSYLQYKVGLLDIQNWVRSMSLEVAAQEPSSSANAGTGSMPNVNGSSNTRPTAPPSPGTAPIQIPINTPSNKKMSDCHWSARLRPDSSVSITT